MYLNKLSKAIILAMAAQTVIAADVLNEVNTLAPIVVTASLNTQKVAEAPAFTTVVTVKDIENSSTTSLADLLGKTAGVQNYTSGGRDDIRVSGLGKGYTLILVNGRRVSSLGGLWRGGDFDYSAIPLNSIARVEVVRGPMSVLYGADAIGGVINIITKKPTKAWQGTVNGEYRVLDEGTGKNQYRLGISSSGALADHLRLAVSAEQYDRDAWYLEGKLASPAYYIEGKKSQNLQSTLSWDINDQQTLNINLGYNRDKRPYAIDNYTYYPAYNFTSISSSGQEIERYSVDLEHEGTWDWGSSNVSVKREDSDISDSNTNYNAPQQREINETNTYARAYANFDYLINAFTLGTDYRLQELKDRATFKASGSGDMHSNAVFAQDDIHLTDQLSLTLSGRMDDHEYFGNHFTPRAYAVYKLNDDMIIKGGYGEAFKAPGLHQILPDYSIISCGGSCFLTGNAELKPETSKNYEIGFDVQKSNWHATGTVFKNKVDDLIDRDITYNAQGKATAAKWINISKATLKGLELQGDVDVIDGVDLSGNYTYLDTEDDKGNELNERPKNKANISLNWMLANDLTATVGTDYIGSQKQDTVKLPDYQLVNLGFKSIINKALTIRVGVQNLTNVNLKEKSVDFYTRELGRNYYVGASYNF